MNHLMLFEELNNPDFNKNKKYLEILFTVCFKKYQSNQKTNLIEKLRGILEIIDKFDNKLSVDQIDEMKDLIRVFIIQLKDMIEENIGDYNYEIRPLREVIQEIENFTE